MPPRAQELTIDRNWRFLLAPCLTMLVLGSRVAVHLEKATKQTYDWGYILFGVTMFVAIFAALAWRLVQGRLLRFVVMDDAGLSIFGRSSVRLAWSDVSACACQNEPGRRILRLFPRLGVQTPLNRLAGAETYIDVDFAAAATPQNSLDRAFRACAETLASRSGAAAVRPFVEHGRFLRRTLAAFGYAALVLAVGAVAVLAFIAVISPLPEGVIGGAGLGWLTRPMISWLPRPVQEEAPMPVDARPARRVLFLGNGRISDRDIPRRVREIADFANSPIRFDIHMRAWGAATLKEHWRDAGDQALLRQNWDEVVIQPQSGAFADEQSARDFQEYGARLITAAQASGAHVHVIANWTRGADYFDNRPQNLFQSERGTAVAASMSYGAQIERKTRALAADAGAGVIDLAAAFADAQQAAADVELLEDGNHATNEGVYLAALVIYGDLAKADVAKLSRRPVGVSEPAAAALRAVAARHLQQAGALE